MPELPDVEGFRCYIESTSLHKTVEKVDVRSPEILKGASADALVRGLKGARLESTRRHGKYLFVRLDNGCWLLYHFGMTGRPKHFKDMSEDPRHDRLLISFTNRFHLAFDCQRKLGMVGLIENVDDFIRKKKLGPDALDIDFVTFKKALQWRRGSIKSALMNQKIIAGIGNVYADEILFQAQIHPRTRPELLSKKRLRKLFDSMGKVLAIGIDHTVHSKEFPGSYLLSHRGEGETCPRCVSKIVRLKIAGRSAYYCPECQTEKQKGTIRRDLT